MQMAAKKSLASKFIGDKAFYKMVLAVAVPIMVQNGISNFVGLLDNIMVGQTGTEQMSGVAIVNQLFFVYYLCIFGGLAGAGIFTAQYFGTKDYEGIRTTFRFKFWMGLVITFGALVIFTLFGKNLIFTYLQGSNDGGDIMLALKAGESYMRLMLIGFMPFMFLQVYAGVLRECGETVIPMKAGIIAVLVNLVFNYILIYGHFGFPAMGVNGAAIATVISRFVEVGIVIIWTTKNREKCRYLDGVFSTLRVPMNLVRKYFITSIPLLLNETLWSTGFALLTQCYSKRGLNVVAGYNIAGTINNLFNVIFFAMGDAIAIIVGQLLGAGKMEEARDTDNKIIAFGVFCGALSGLMAAAVSGIFPLIYKTNPEARHIATLFILVQALFTPQMAFLHSSYFTLRSGGRTMITFIFDSVFMWCISVPTAYVISRYTDINAILMYAIVQAVEISKVIIGFILLKKGTWMRNIVRKENLERT